MDQQSIYLDVIFELMVLSLVDNETADNITKSEAFVLLSEQIEELTALASVTERGIVLSDELPLGYLTKHHAGWSFAIPWMLAETFPIDETLVEFCGFAARVKIGQNSLLCLSGTSARAGGIAEIGDVDFAEYVFDDKTGVRILYDRVLRDCDGHIFPTVAKAFSAHENERFSVKCPFGANDNVEQEGFLKIVGLQQTKVDFIGKSSAYGYLPITNMIFPSDIVPYKQGLARSSFSFQEAVMARGTDSLGKAWPLVDLAETFDYIRFLIQDTTYYIDKRPVKAAKRAGALLKILHMPKYDEELSSVLNSDYAGHDAIKSRVSEVRSMAANCDREDERYASVSGVLEDINENDGIVPEPKDFKFQDLRCKTLVRTIMADIRSAVEVADKRLSSIVFKER